VKNESTLSYSLLENGILELVFQKSSVPIAFGLTEARVLLTAIEEIEETLKDQVKGILLRSSAERIFCAGGNLKDYAKGMNDPMIGQNVNREIRSILNRLTQIKIPTAVAVKGDCYGGGVELISCFDIIYASPCSYFALWQRKVALSFGWGGAERLRERMSLKSIRQLALSTQTIDVYQAQSLGLIDAVFETHLLGERAQDWLLSQANLPKNPIGAIKKWPQSDEAALFENLWLNSEHKKALSKYIR
jgi:methylglutaconyl-CoA hydratase